MKNRTKKRLPDEGSRFGMHDVLNLDSGTFVGQIRFLFVV